MERKREAASSAEKGVACDMGQEAEETGEQVVQWVVESVSSESELYPAVSVLDGDLGKPWLTQRPTNDAWVVLESRPPTAFDRVEVVNAGSALVEIHGLREEGEADADGGYELLLSAQQVITSISVAVSFSRASSVHDCAWITKPSSLTFLLLRVRVLVLSIVLL